MSNGHDEHGAAAGRNQNKPNIEHRTPNIEHRMTERPLAATKGTNIEHRTPNIEHRMTERPHSLPAQSSVSHPARVSCRGNKKLRDSSTKWRPRRPRQSRAAFPSCSSSHDYQPVPRLLYRILASDRSQVLDPHVKATPTASPFPIPHSMLDVRCSVFDVRCSVFGVRCSMFDVPHSPFPIRCSMFDVRDFHILTPKGSSHALPPTGSRRA